MAQITKYVSQCDLCSFEMEATERGALEGWTKIYLGHEGAFVQEYDDIYWQEKQLDCCPACFKEYKANYLDFLTLKGLKLPYPGPSAQKAVKAIADQLERFGTVNLTEAAPILIPLFKQILKTWERNDGGRQ